MQHAAVAGLPRFQAPPAAPGAASHAAAYLALHEATGPGMDCWQALSETTRATDSLAFRANLLALDASLRDPQAGPPHAAASVAARAFQLDRGAAELAARLREVVLTATERLQAATMPPDIVTDTVESAIDLGGRLAVIVQQVARAELAVPAQDLVGAPAPDALPATQAMRELELLAERIAAAVGALRARTLGEAAPAPCSLCLPAMSSARVAGF